MYIRIGVNENSPRVQENRKCRVVSLPTCGRGAEKLRPITASEGCQYHPASYLVFDWYLEQQNCDMSQETSAGLTRGKLSERPTRLRVSSNPSEPSIEFYVYGPCKQHLS